MTEPLDLAELARACMATGMGAVVRDGALFFDSDPTSSLPSYVGSWNGTREDGTTAFALRDAVRKVLPGSYCIPITRHQLGTYGPLRVRFADAFGHFPPCMDGEGYGDKRFRSLPRWVAGGTETECWARALVALHRAGLLSVSGRFDVAVPYELNQDHVQDRERNGNPEQSSQEIPGVHCGQDTGGFA